MNTPGKAKYKGDMTNQLEPGHRMGPTNYGSYVYVESIIYDKATDTTIVKFKTEQD